MTADEIKVNIPGPAALCRRIGAEIALSSIEQRVLDFCVRAAKDARPLESVEEIMEAIGAQSYSTVPGIMKRLEVKGYISRNIYQRGRQVCIVATGQCSAPPRDTTPHWRLRDRRDDPPAPAIHQLRSRMPQEAMTIEQEARRMGKGVADFLADLVYIGWAEYRAEQAREAA